MNNKYSLADLFDDALGGWNFIDPFLGWLQLQTRRGSRRRRQRYGRTETVRVTIPRGDKEPGVQPFLAIQKHMRRYGVELYGHTHNSRFFYARVPRRQYAWFLRLYNGGQLWAPVTAWREKRR